MQGEPSTVEMEAEIGVMQPQAKECLGLPELEGARKDPPREVSEGTRPCQHVDFIFLGSRCVRE